jgi:hypothetical protein
MKTKKQRKDLLNRFYQSFTEYTLGQIKCKPVDRGIAYGGWFELIFRDSLHAEELLEISNFLGEKFYQEGRYSHLLPKLIPTREGISLIVQDREVERISTAGKI